MHFYVRCYHREAFWEWCADNNIICQFEGVHLIPDITRPIDYWFIENEEDAVLAIVKWAENTP